ncbi:unnamed protein product [Polarella glacialis]|uniref:EXPERA domain-containing protein n=1 Tax=Polarella glacialis TaxID=89957 RepID=A0A813D8X3_POLGL|nr:unnamed protein product [Polarella glacialis]
MKGSNLVLVLLQAYFMLMNFTVERNYCHGPLKPDDSRFLMKEAYDFSIDNNPLFLSRPEWIRLATCVSAYGFCGFYFLIAITALTDAWAGPMRLPIVLFIGGKAYAVFFYHLMEFSHETLAPKNLVPYFVAEGPYIVGMAGVMLKCAYASSATNKAKSA